MSFPFSQQPFHIYYALRISTILRPCTRFADSDLVQIEVGPGQKKFTVHKDFVSDASTFLKAAFRENSDFRENNDQLVKLPEDDPDTFEAFLAYAYSDEFTGLDLRDLEDNNTARLKALDDLVTLYVFADKIGAQELKRCMIETWLGYMASYCDYIIPRSRLRSLYEKTMPGSGLRKIAVALHVWEDRWEGDKKEIDEICEEYSRLALECPELGADLVRQLFLQSSGKATTLYQTGPATFYEPCMKEDEVTEADGGDRG